MGLRKNNSFSPERAIKLSAGRCSRTLWAWSEAVRDSEKQRKSEWWKMTFGAKQENGPGLIFATVSHRFMSLCSWNMGENINPHNAWAIGPLGGKKASLSDRSIRSLVNRLHVKDCSSPGGHQKLFCLSEQSLSDCRKGWEFYVIRFQSSVAL